MKTFDFSRLGGYKSSQRTVREMQAAYLDIAKALTSISNDPVILSGCGWEYSTSGPQFNVQAGFIAYQGRVITVPATVVDVSLQGIPRLKLTTTVENATFYNGQVHPMITDVTATVVADGTGSWVFENLKNELEVRAASLRSVWAVAYDNTDGYVRFQVDKVAKVCWVQGWRKHYTNYGDNMPYNMGAIVGLPRPEIPPGSTRLYFPTSLEVHQRPVIKTSEGVEYRGGMVAISSQGTTGTLSIASRRLDPTLTVAQIDAIKHFFSFSYPIPQ